MLEFIGAVVIILLGMVSYSSGITLAAKRREYELGVLDLISVFVLWVILFSVREGLARIPELALTIVLGLIFGYIIGAIRFSRQDTAKIIPKSELPEHAREKIERGESLSLFRRIWQRWVDFSGRMGNIQGRLLMGFFYFLVVTPFGLLYRLFADPLGIKKTPSSSNWGAKEPTDLTIEASREQG